MKNNLRVRNKNRKNIYRNNLKKITTKKRFNELFGK